MYGNFHLKVCVVQSKGRGVDAGVILLTGICPVRSAVRAEHDKEQDNQQDAKCRKNGSVDDLLHVQDNEFSSGTHRVTSRNMWLPFYGGPLFYKCMTEKGKIFTAYA